MRTTCVPFYIRPLLWFRPRIVTRDEEYPYVVELHAKRLFGRTYILDFKRYIPPPEHFNCRCTLTRVEKQDDEV